MAVNFSRRFVLSALSRPSRRITVVSEATDSSVSLLSVLMSQRTERGSMSERRKSTERAEGDTRSRRPHWERKATAGAEGDSRRTKQRGEMALREKENMGRGEGKRGVYDDRVGVVK